MTDRSKQKVPAWIWKMAISAVIFSVIYYIVFHTSTKTGEWEVVWNSLLELSPLMIFVVVLLAVVNWLLESYKWKILIKRIEEVQLIYALKGVLTGLSFGFVTPRSVGDYFGRMLHLRSKNRSRVVGALIISRLSQLFMTLLFGGFGLIYFVSRGYFTFSASMNVNFVFMFLLFVVVILLFLFRRWIIRKVFVGTFNEKVVRLISIIKEYHNAEITLSLGLSLIRYIVFSGQFVLVLLVLGFDAKVLPTFLGVSMVYLAKSAFVSFNFLSDLGVRELAALSFLTKLSDQPEVIVTASLLIWLINILLPTIMGAILTTTIKLRPS